MRRNGILSVALASLMTVCLTPPVSALAAVEELSGSVVAGSQLSVAAPFGGEISAIHVREGEWVEQGDALATLKTTKVYAPMNGTVSGILFEEGDDVDGTVMSIAPVSKYTVTAVVSEQYGSDDPANRYINLGETVYIRCQKGHSHVAQGRVTAVTGNGYTVETTGGELYLEEDVDVFRDSRYAFLSLIGSGTVSRTSSWEVSGSGSLLRLHVSEGETVERGQLLFETVEGPLDKLIAEGRDILATTGGVIASLPLSVGGKVSKGGSAATLYPREGFQLAVVVPEDMITLIEEGDVLRFYLDWDEENPRWYEGTVSALSYISTMTTDSTTTFTAYVDFDADESVRLGMTAVVEVETP